MTNNKYASAILDFVTIPADIKEDINNLNSNLLFGPSSGTFSYDVRERVNEWFYDLPTMYYDESLDIVTSKLDDESDCEKYLTELSTSVVADALLGEYAAYI